jgi:adenylate cyclase
LKQHIIRIALGLAVVLIFLGHAARLYQIPFITQVDNIIYDARLRLTMPGDVDERIVILDIDEKSLAVPELGRWPWGRDRVAALVQKLLDKYGVLIIGFDVVFAEPDVSSGLKVLEQLARKEFSGVSQFAQTLNQLRPQLDHDGSFAKVMKGRPVVLGYYFNSDEDARESGALPEAVLPAGTFAGRNIGFTSWRGYGANLPEFQAAAASAGHFNPFVDFDGVSRRVPLLAEYKGRYYEALSLAMVRVLLGRPRIEPGYPPEKFATKSYAGMEWLDVGPLKIPVDETVSAFVPYRGKRGSYPYISLSDVYFDKVPAEKLKGKIALIGTSAPGLLDLRSTPVSSTYPGVEIHANMIAGMLDRTLKEKPSYMLGAEVALIVLGGVALSLLLPFLSPLRAMLLSLFGILMFAGINLGIWSGAAMILPLATALLMTVALFTVNMAYGYFIESRSKRQFTELFGQYVPPELVDKMAQDPEKYNMEGKKENLTVLFSDVRGFTTISESLEPAELAQFINEYLTSMSLVIRNNRGTLDKYIGDAIMAFWGAPVSDAEHARQGVITALMMQEELGELQRKFRERGWPDIKIGIGVNTGDMTVGDMGSKVRKAYTVMGDAVNLGSRLEGITKQYGVGILIGEDTRKAVSDVLFREIDKVRVKGKDEPVTIYEPIGIEGSVRKEKIEEVKLWHAALKLYRGQHWDQAEVQLLNLQRMYPECHLYEIYAGKIAEHRAHPPEPGWDGVTKFDTK